MYEMSRRRRKVLNPFLHVFTQQQGNILWLTLLLLVLKRNMSSRTRRAANTVCWVHRSKTLLMEPMFSRVIIRAEELDR